MGHLVDKIDTHVVLNRIKSGVKSRVWDVGTSSLQRHAAAGQLNTVMDGMIRIGCRPVGTSCLGLGRWNWIMLGRF